MDGPCAGQTLSAQKINRFLTQSSGQRSLSHLPMAFPNNAGQAPPCPILRVPNEVLHEIFRYVGDWMEGPRDRRKEVRRFREKVRDRNSAQWALFVLRQVCTRFRLITNELIAWMANRDGGDLLNFNPNGFPRNVADWDEEVQFLENLFSRRPPSAKSRR